MTSSNHVRNGVHFYAAFCMLMFRRQWIKQVKFVAFRGKTQHFAVLGGQIREFCEPRDGREKFTALAIVCV